MDISLFAFLGFAWGFASDRIAARWPAHEDGSVRKADWRTALVVVAGGVSFWATGARFGGDVVQFAFVGMYVSALILLFATDLDQKLLPDVITLPLIALALGAFATGAGPYVHSVEDLAWAAAATVGVVVGLYLLSIPFGAGAIGEGDLKLLLSVGLMAGAAHLFYGLVVGAVLAGIVIAILVFVRRLSMKSFVPYGPFLIAGALWAILFLPE